MYLLHTTGIYNYIALAVVYFASIHVVHGTRSADNYWILNIIYTAEVTWLLVNGSHPRTKPSGSL